jgi:hypothetical protein
MSKCPLKAFDLLQRRQYARYTGKAVGGTGGFPYVLAINPPSQPFTVPLTKYWVVWSLSLLAGKGSSALSGPGIEVYLIPPGTPLPTSQPGGANDSWFLNYNAFINRNGGPGLYGLRIDRANLAATGEWFSLSNLDNEVQMFEKPFFVAPGETLMGWQMQTGTPSNPGALLEMRICYSQMDSSEDVELGFL